TSRSRPRAPAARWTWPWTSRRCPTLRCCASPASTCARWDSAEEMAMPVKRFAVPLTIAGSDPTGGAGLQADLKVFLRYGLSGAAVCSAVTVQSPTEVKAVHPVEAAVLTAQLEALLRDVRPAAVKVGMLGSGENIRAAARALL